MKWLDEIPLVALLIAAVLMAMLPMQPEAHLVEKLRMFRAGTLTEFIDMLDVLWHAFPSLLLVLKLVLNTFGRKHGQ